MTNAGVPERLVVAAVGASAGGVQELSRFAAELPADRSFALLVVLHLSPRSPSVLAQILQRRTDWEVAIPRDEAPLERGHVYVAPPDQHLVVEDGHVRLNREPRENGHRPAFDTTLRSLAHFYGGDAVGVVLTGLGDDGSLGVADIKAAGGRVLVQDPDECVYDSMPRSAIATTQVDRVASVPELVADLGAFAEAARSPKPSEPMPDVPQPVPDISGFSCPACGGVLTHEVSDHSESYVCRIGHRYSLAGFEEEQHRALESALWAAVRALEERADLLRRLARRSLRGGVDFPGGRFEIEAAEAYEQAQQIREIIVRPMAQEDPR